MIKGGSLVLIAGHRTEICGALLRLLQQEGLVGVIAPDGSTALKIIRQDHPEAFLVDSNMLDISGLELLRRARTLDWRLPVILMTEHPEVREAVEAMRVGAYDYLPQPLNHQAVIQIILRALKEREHKQTPANPSHRLDPDVTLREMMGPGDAIERLICHVNRVAKSNFSVVILGETGSGKELVARAIHDASLRSRAPFMPLDCGAIPETLLESELFGYERGAFTGANAQRPGMFEAAHGGTLFLDEVSNMPLGSQAKLLRVLQEKSVYRLGSARPVGVDIRVLAASNHDLETLDGSGSFRRDLFFRLNEFTIVIPPLRERKEDIPYLAKRFLDVTNAELNKGVKGFSDSAIETLLAYAWPGNVRQLRSTIRRAVLLADEVITEEHLDIHKLVHPERNPGLPRPPRPVVTTWGDASLKEIVRRNVMCVEREVLLQVLQETRGNKARAARLLQIDYKTICSKVKGYGIAFDPEESYA